MGSPCSVQSIPAELGVPPARMLTRASWVGTGPWAHSLGRTASKAPQAPACDRLQGSSDWAQQEKQKQAKP